MSLGVSFCIMSFMQSCDRKTLSFVAFEGYLDTDKGMDRGVSIIIFLFIDDIFKLQLEFCLVSMMKTNSNCM